MTNARRREVAVGLIVDDDGQLLLQHRDADPSITGAGLWGFFGGHLEPGEAPSRAFVREMAEELGWQPRHFEHYLTTDAPPLPGDKDYGRGNVSHVFAAHLDLPFDQLTLGEGQAMELYAPAQLPVAIVPGLVPVIEEFARSRTYGRVRRAWDIISTTALLVDARGRFLLQLRDDKPDIENPGRWGSFGGQAESRETPEEGFQREMEEELGWRPRTYALYDAVPYRTLREGDTRRQLIYIYAAAVDVPVDSLVLGEGQAMAFFAPDELPENIVPALRGLIECFSGAQMYREMMERATAGR